jgi:phosphoserine phosphatase
MINLRKKMILQHSKMLAAVLGLVTVWGFHAAAEAKGARWSINGSQSLTPGVVKARASQQKLRYHQAVNLSRFSRFNNAPSRHDKKFNQALQLSSREAPHSRTQRAYLETGGKHNKRKIPRHMMRRLSPQVRDVLDYLYRTGKKGPATFDGDGTLWAGDVGLGFFAWMLRKGHYPQARQQMLEVAWKQYRKGAYDGEKFYELMVTSMAGMKESKVTKLAGDYFRREHRKRIYRPMVNMIAALDRLGIDPWVVSGSPQWVVAAGAKYLGIPRNRVIGLSVHVDKKGRLTDQIVRPVPWKSGKAKRIMAEVGQVPIFAAGNSYGDIQMLRIASEPPLVINPCPTTLQAAQNHGWTVHRYTQSDEVALRGGGLLRRLSTAGSYRPLSP